MQTSCLLLLGSCPAASIALKEYTRKGTLGNPFTDTALLMLPFQVCHEAFIHNVPETVFKYIQTINTSSNMEP